MKPLLRSGVPLWTVLVLSALLKISRAECDQCNNSVTGISTTTTTITYESKTNCILSTVNNISGDRSIDGLTPGTVYQVVISCKACCKNVTTKPEKVQNLTVTEITTSSVSLSWTKPGGHISGYRVQWTGGEKDVTAAETTINITGLTAGVEYNITVTAVAGNGETEGEEATISKYTKPEAVGSLTVTETTSSVSLSWTKPGGHISVYSVQLTGGEINVTKNTTETTMNIPGLTAGVEYEITVTAVAGDGQTEGEKVTVSKYTK